MLNERMFVSAIVKKLPNGKNLGTFDCREKAEQHEREVMYFKNKRAFVDLKSMTDKEKEKQEGETGKDLTGPSLGNSSITHDFPASSNDIINRRRPGYFKWLMPKDQVTPQTGSPGDFESAPRRDEASLKKKVWGYTYTVSSRVSVLFNKANDEAGGKLNMADYKIEPDTTYGADGIDGNACYGIINYAGNKVHFRVYLDGKDYVLDKGSMIGYEDMFSNVVKLFPSFDAFIKEHMRDYGEQKLTNNPAHPSSGGMPKTPTDTPPKGQLETILKQIPDDKYTKEMIQGHNWSVYKMPIQEFYDLMTKGMVKKEFFDKQKSGLLEYFIWAIKADYVLIMK